MKVMSHYNEIKKYEYTRQAANKVYELIANENFDRLEPKEILNFLITSIESYSFSDYLKRYIYNRCDFSSDFSEVTDEEYIWIIKESFHKARCPYRMNSQNVWEEAVVRRWLNSSFITREGMFHMAYGMRMTPEEVSEFLIKSLQEHDFDFSDPYETVSWYCYRNNLSYKESIRLISKSYTKNKSNYEGSYHSFEPLKILKNEKQLIEYTSYLIINNVTNQINHKRRIIFKKLLSELKDSIYKQRHLFSFDRTCNSPEDITFGEIERIICSSIPIDEDGKYIKQRESLLYRKIRSHKISRQRLGTLYKDKSFIRRYEIIQLKFFIIAINYYENYDRNLVNKFLEEINEVLFYCGYEKMYIANIYEAFVILCLNNTSPLETYEEVIEISYIKEHSEV